VQGLPADFRSFPLTLPNSETQNDLSAVHSRLQTVRNLIEEHDGVCQAAFDHAQEVRTGVYEDEADDQPIYYWNLRLEEEERKGKSEDRRKEETSKALTDFASFMRDSRKQGVLGTA
jgi:hypothetical protein